MRTVPLSFVGINSGLGVDESLVGVEGSKDLAIVLKDAGDALEGKR